MSCRCRSGGDHCAPRSAAHCAPARRGHAGGPARGRAPGGPGLSVFRRHDHHPERWLSPITAAPVPGHLLIDPPCAARLAAVRFDFAAKQLAALNAGEVRAAMASGAFIWLDIDYVDAAEARRLLADVGLPGEGLIDGLFNTEANTFLSRQEESLHLVIADCQIGAEGSLTPEPVHVVMTRHYLLTLHDGPRIFLNAMRREYASDFVRFAQSPSFLIYELWDHLVEHYAGVQERLEAGVRDLQRQLFADD